MGGVQIPAWITVALGVLAVLGTVGGAWGGQLISGRNDRRRWNREVDREREAHWRDKRLEIYSTVLAAAQDATRALELAFESDPAEQPDDSAHPLTIEHIDSELQTLWIIGTTDSVDLTMAIRFSLLYGAPLARVPEDQLSPGMTRDKLRDNARELQQLVVALRGQFRVDLGLDPRNRETATPAGRL